MSQKHTQIPAYRLSVVIATELLSNEETPHFGEKPQRVAVADRLLSYTTPPNTDSSVPSFRCHSTDSASAQTGHVKAAAHRDTALPTQIPMCSPSDVTQQQTQIPAYRRSVVIATELLSNEQTPHFGEKPQRMAVADRLLSYTTPPNTACDIYTPKHTLRHRLRPLAPTPQAVPALARPGLARPGLARRRQVPAPQAPARPRPGPPLRPPQAPARPRPPAQPGHVKAAAHRNTTLPTQIPM